MTNARTFQSIPAHEAAALIRAEAKPAVFDVRSISDYQQGHIPDAAHLGESRLAGWLGRLAKDQAIVIYCYRGNASRTFAQMFADFRFTRVYSVEGGYSPLAQALAESAA